MLVLSRKVSETIRLTLGGDKLWCGTCQKYLEPEEIFISGLGGTDKCFHCGEQINTNEQPPVTPVVITVTLTEMRGNQVKLGIEAPPEYNIDRIHNLPKRGDQGEQDSY